MLTQIIYDFEAAQQRGEQPDLATFLNRGEADTGELLRELVLIDVEYRHQRGESVRVADYLARFPQLRSETEVMLALARAECRFCRQAGEPVPLENLRAQYPELSTRLLDPGDTPVETPRPREDTLSLTLAGHELLGELGRGGMGVVYRARQIDLDRIVAVKMILAGAHASEEERERFRREARLVAALQHPTIVQIYEVGSHAGNLWLTLEYCAGGSLADLLRQTPLPAREAASLVQKLAEGIQFAHERGIVHRDLKPANVLLATSTRGDGTVPAPGSPPWTGAKIADFGLARKLDAPGQTQSGAIVGTPSYMAPEQARGEKEIGPAADIYALGAILYECLTGRPPFRAATALDTVLQVVTDDPVAPSRLQPTTPRDLETITLKCLQKEVSRRYGNAQELADDLGRFLEGKTILARPAGRLERGWRWCRRNPVVASLTALLAVTLVGASVIFYGLWQRAERASADLRKVLGEVVVAATDALDEPDEVKRAAARLRLQVAREVTGQTGQAGEKATAEPSDDRFPVLSTLLQGDLQREADPQAAIRTYQQALPLARDRARARPADAQAQRDYLIVLNRLGECHEARLENGKAAKFFDQALAGAEQAANQFPEHLDTQRFLIKCWNDRGRLHEKNGNWTAALPCFDSGRSLTEVLLRKYPRNVDLQHDLSVSFELTSDVQKAQGNLPLALQAAKRTLDLRATLVGDHPRTRHWAKDLAIAYRKLGDLHDQMNQPMEARRAFEAGYAVSRNLVSPRGATASDLNELALWQQRLGTLAMHMEDLASAQSAFETYLGLVEQALMKDPANLLARRNLGVAYNYLGRLHLKGMEYAKGKAYFQKSLPIARELAEKNPEQLVFVRDLALVHLLLGLAEKELDDLEQAWLNYLACHDIFRDLARKNPRIVEHQTDLAEICDNLAELALDKSHAPEKAIEWCQRGLDGLANFQGAGQGKISTIQHYRAKLNGLLQQARQTVQLLASLEFAFTQPADQQPGLLVLRGRILARRSQPAEVAATAEALAGLKLPMGGGFYDAACLYSLSLDGRLPLAVRQRHTDLARQHLRRAIRAGYRDLVHLHRDPDLARLRALPDYPLFFAELRALTMP